MPASSALIFYNASIEIWRRTITFDKSSSMQPLYLGISARIYAPGVNAINVLAKRFGTELVFNILTAFDVDLRANDQVRGYNPFGIEEEPLYTCRTVIIRGDGPGAHRHGYIVQVARGAGQ